jgi:hypothetical protein
MHPVSAQLKTARMVARDKKTTDQSTKSELISLANCVANRDDQLLAGMINSSLYKQVTNDLSPLSPDQVSEISKAADEYVIEPSDVFNKLSRIKVHKSPGPDGIPNCLTRFCIRHR